MTANSAKSCNNIHTKYDILNIVAAMMQGFLATYTQLHSQERLSAELSEPHYCC